MLTARLKAKLPVTSTAEGSLRVQTRLFTLHSCPRTSVPGPHVAKSHALKSRLELSVCPSWARGSAGREGARGV